jgi:hypothetical protein
MFAHKSLDCTGNEGDECATGGSSENVREKYLRIRRMEVPFNSGQVQKKLAANCSPQSSNQGVAEHSQMEMFCNPRNQIACGYAADNLKNETRYIHENIS